MRLGWWAVLGLGVSTSATASCGTKANPLWNFTSGSADAATTSDTSTDAGGGTSAAATADATGNASATATSTTAAITTDAMASSSGDGSTGGVATGPCDFFDDFERPDNDNLGNGWIERNPTAMRVAGGEVVYESNGSAYFNSVWYRPLDTLCANAELTLEVQFDDPMSVGFPQVHARIQPDALDQGVLQSYICFLENGPELRLRRQGVAGPTNLEISPFSHAFTESDEYRVRMRISGSSPVSIECFFEILGDPTWEVLGSLTHEDNDAVAFTAPGSFGASSNTNPVLLRYDNFRATALPSP